MSGSDEKYYALDTSGEVDPELCMTREACMAQPDVCGAMVSYVNNNINDEESRRLLNEATFKIKQAYRRIGKLE